MKKQRTNNNEIIIKSDGLYRFKGSSFSDAEVIMIDDRAKNKRGYWEKIKNLHFCPICHRSYMKLESVKHCELFCEEMVKIYIKYDKISREDAIKRYRMEAL